MTGAPADVSVAPDGVPARPPISVPAWIGFIVLVIFFGGGGAWSVLFPLSSAAVSQGVVTVDTNRKTIQHLEGGIIREILVKNGDMIGAGDVLVRLDDAQSRARSALVQGQYDAFKVLEARLVAERDGARTITIPPDLLARREEPSMRKILDGQQTIFKSRRRALVGQKKILRQRIDETRAEIKSMRAQAKAARVQQGLVAQEIATVQGLVERGLARKPRLLSLQRESARLAGARDEQLGRVAQAQQRIGETELQIINLGDQRRNEVVAELRQAQSQLSDIAERLQSALDILERGEIRAPIPGTVVNLRYFTAGGVIGAGLPIMDIVPKDDRLIVEARVRTIDIDVVKAGLTAQVRLSAFKQRTTPVLKGRVIYISADSLVDERTGEAYYTARIEIPTAEMERLDGLVLSQGMPTEVMIVTGERTAFEYLVGPLRDSFRRAFREE